MITPKNKDEAQFLRNRTYSHYRRYSDADRAQLEAEKDLTERRKKADRAAGVDCECFEISDNWDRDNVETHRECPCHGKDRHTSLRRYLVEQLKENDESFGDIIAFSPELSDERLDRLVNDLDHLPNLTLWTSNRVYFVVKDDEYGDCIDSVPRNPPAKKENNA